MTENTLEKLAQLLEQDQFELSFFRKRSWQRTGYTAGIPDE